MLSPRKEWDLLWWILWEWGWGEEIQSAFQRWVQLQSRVRKGMHSNWPLVWRMREPQGLERCKRLSLPVIFQCLIPLKQLWQGNAQPSVWITPLMGTFQPDKNPSQLGTVLLENWTFCWVEIYLPVASTKSGLTLIWGRLEDKPDSSSTQQP